MMFATVLCCFPERNGSPRRAVSLSSSTVGRNFRSFAGISDPAEKAISYTYCSGAVGSQQTEHTVVDLQG